MSICFCVVFCALHWLLSPFCASHPLLPFAHHTTLHPVSGRRYKPFLSDELDVVEAVSRMTVVASVLFTLLIRNNITIEDLDLDTDAYGMAINVCNLAAMVLFVVCMLYSLPSVKLCVKNWRQALTFSDSMTLMEGSAERIVPHWHVDTEIRHRIWYEFWTDSLARIGGEDSQVSSEGLSLGPTSRRHRVTLLHFTPLHIALQ